ncbi:hypothetical protein M5K25_008990 [Dendrobium thyrsiflorum]|uniref:Uncharacterized protein n=1 Tax=Dendrobium thyrsiflorum TaxID=117978 RepID=A0ABD0VGU5_DENTH
MSTLASRCASLCRFRFRGSESAAAIINLHACDLQEIAGDYCHDITDVTLSVIAAQYKALESLQIGPDPCEKISSDAIRHVAMCCSRFRRLCLSGIRELMASPLAPWQGAALVLSLVNNSQEVVQERAAAGLATFMVIDDENATVDPARVEVVMKNGGIPLLLEQARGCWGLWNLSVGEEHKIAIVEAGDVKAQVDLIFKWPTGIDGVLERAARAVANLAADEQCSMEVAMAGGVNV